MKTELNQNKTKRKATLFRSVYWVVRRFLGRQGVEHKEEQSRERERSTQTEQGQNSLREIECDHVRFLEPIQLFLAFLPFRYIILILL